MDHIALQLWLGSWTDPEDYHGCHVLAEFEVPSDEKADLPAHHELIGLLRSSGLEPWQIELRERHYFANASSDSLLLLVFLYQSLGPALLNEAAKDVARRIVGAVWEALPRPRKTGLPRRSLSEASRSVQDYFVNRDRIAPDEIEEVHAQSLEDGFEFVVRIRPTRAVYYVRCEASGTVSARLSLDELEQMKALSSTRLPDG